MNVADLICAHARASLFRLARSQRGSARKRGYDDGDDGSDPKRARH